jgi:hypothetical protein
MGQVLTPELVWADEDFENVLTLPLPLNPRCELLCGARSAERLYRLGCGISPNGSSLQKSSRNSAQCGNLSKTKIVCVAQ